MNKDQVEGRAQTVKGDVKNDVGNAIKNAIDR
jgi:uncharacterized protein YjbJ (UPF0337 family)